MLKYIVLLEPDHKVARMLQKAVARLSSCEITLVHSAQEAIHSCDTRLPDLIIVELSVPEQNGFAFLHELRSHGDWLGVPVIVHSNIPREEVALSPRDWSKLGVDTYLYKPTTTLEELTRRIQSVLEI